MRPAHTNCGTNTKYRFITFRIGSNIRFLRPHTSQISNSSFKRTLNQWGDWRPWPARTHACASKDEPQETTSGYATRSQNAAEPRRSVRLRARRQQATSTDKKRQQKKPRGRPHKRSQPDKTEQYADETESDSDIQVYNKPCIECKQERDLAAPVLDRLIALADRMEGHLQENEVGRARERAEINETHRRERREMRRFFNDMIQSNAQQMQMATTAFREAFEARARYQDEANQESEQGLQG